ncbi:unnamed protein product, partial [Polarella glacialis]
AAQGTSSAREAPMTPSPVSSAPRRGSVGASLRPRAVQQRRALSATSGKALLRSPEQSSVKNGPTPWRPSGGGAASQVFSPPARSTSRAGRSASSASLVYGRVQAGKVSQPLQDHFARHAPCTVVDRTSPEKDMRKMKAASDLFQENQALRTLAERLQRELAAVEEEGKRYFDELLAAEALSVSEGADRG